MAQPPDGRDRRKFTRIQKNYILRFYQKGKPDQKYEITQLNNISRGGMCFISTLPFKRDDVLAIELRTPYLAETVYFQGHVLETHEKVKDMIFEVRLKFDDLSPLAEDVIAKMEEYAQQGE